MPKTWTWSSPQRSKWAALCWIWTQRVKNETARFPSVEYRAHQVDRLSLNWRKSFYPEISCIWNTVLPLVWICVFNMTFSCCLNFSPKINIMAFDQYLSHCCWRYSVVFLFICCLLLICNLIWSDIYEVNDQHSTEFTVESLVCRFLQSDMIYKPFTLMNKISDSVRNYRFLKCSGSFVILFCIP